MQNTQAYTRTYTQTEQTEVALLLLLLRNSYVSESSLMLGRKFAGFPSDLNLQGN